TRIVPCRDVMVSSPLCHLLFVKVSYLSSDGDVGAARPRRCLTATRCEGDGGCNRTFSFVVVGVFGIPLSRHCERSEAIFVRAGLLRRPSAASQRRIAKEKSPGSRPGFVLLRG